MDDFSFSDVQWQELERRVVAPLAAPFTVQLIKRRHGVSLRISLRGAMLDWVLRNKVEQVQVFIGGADNQYIRLSPSPDGPFKINVHGRAGLRFIDCGRVPASWPQEARAPVAFSVVSRHETGVVAEAPAGFFDPLPHREEPQAQAANAQPDAALAPKPKKVKAGESVRLNGVVFTGSEIAFCVLLAERVLTPSSMAEELAGAVPVRDFVAAVTSRLRRIEIFVRDMPMKGWRLDAVDKARLRKFLAEAGIQA